MFARLSLRIVTAGIVLQLFALSVFTWATVHVASAALTAGRLAEPAVAFLGDSYTAGTGHRPYWMTTADLMCWDGINLGKRGTGYINPGRRSGVFASRVNQLVRADPSIVIVQGSYNDKKPTAVEPAAQALFESIRARLPRAEVFAIGPASRPKTGSGPLVAANSAAVRQAAADTGVKFIDARNLVPVDSSRFKADKAHPNAVGHKIMGQRLAAMLPQRLNACPDKD